MLPGCTSRGDSRAAAGTFRGPGALKQTRTFPANESGSFSVLSAPPHRHRRRDRHLGAVEQEEGDRPRACLLRRRAGRRPPLDRAPRLAGADALRQRHRLHPGTGRRLRALQRRLGRHRTGRDGQAGAARPRVRARGPALRQRGPRDHGPARRPRAAAAGRPARRRQGHRAPHHRARRPADHGLARGERGHPKLLPRRQGRGPPGSGWLVLDPVVGPGHGHRPVDRRLGDDVLRALLRHVRRGLLRPRLRGRLRLRLRGRPGRRRGGRRRRHGRRRGHGRRRRHGWRHGRRRRRLLRR